jgi:Glycosyltransferases, probably involved in cell wall biogenesis
LVDFSVFYIIIQFIQRFISKYIVVNMEVLTLSLVGLWLIAWVLAAVLPKGKDGKGGMAKRFFASLSRFFLIPAIGFALAYIWPVIIEWEVATFGLSGDAFSAWTVGTVIILVAIGMFVSSRGFSKEPNNKSLLNARQRFAWISYGLTALLAFFILFSVDFRLFRSVMLIIFFFTEIISIVFWFYDPFIYILSQLIHRKRKMPFPPTPEKLNRYAVIGCAHNEAGVIDQLVKSLYATTYPKTKFDVYVICDNCTDNTAEVVRLAGGIAMERNDPDHRGKGFGLKWMFEYLDEQRQNGNEYDAYIVLDADNVVNEEYLDAINERMNEGYEILQTYLGCKNPRDTWISASYSYSYWVSNAVYQNAHSNIGLSAQMGGTGMVLRPSVLDEIGWETDSLTEDLVLTARYVLIKNMSCCWVHEAKLYDEKPLKVIPSIRQRTRWMQGHMAAMFKFGPRLIWNGIKNFSMKQLDVGFYLMRPMLNMLMFAGYIARICFTLFMPETMDVSFIMTANSSILLLLGYFTLQFYVLFCENYGRYIPTFVLQFVFSFTWYPAILRGLIKRNERYWVSTVHTRSIAVTDIKEDAKMLEAKERLRGLDNLHRLPLGQILFKATVISKKQLEDALQFQEEHGGTLGSIILDMKMVSADTLNAYLSLQKTMKEAAAIEGIGDEHLRLGDILVNAGLITPAQLKIALEYQKKHNVRLGDCLVATNIMSDALLKLFLEVQKLLDANYVSPKNAHELINGLLNSSSDNIGTIFLRGGLLSSQQLDYALDRHQKEGGQLGQILIDCGFVNQETLDIILQLQEIGRLHVAKNQIAPYLNQGGVLDG